MGLGCLYIGLCAKLQMRNCEISLDGKMANLVQIEVVKFVSLWDCHKHNVG